MTAINQGYSIKYFDVKIGKLIYHNLNPFFDRAQAYCKIPAGCHNKENGRALLLEAQALFASCQLSLESLQKVQRLENASTILHLRGLINCLSSMTNSLMVLA